MSGQLLGTGLGMQVAPKGLGSCSQESHRHIAWVGLLRGRETDQRCIEGSWVEPVIEEAQGLFQARWPYADRLIDRRVFDSLGGTGSLRVDRGTEGPEEREL